MIMALLFLFDMVVFRLSLLSQCRYIFDDADAGISGLYVSLFEKVIYLEDYIHIILSSSLFPV
jgi:hypothetical protein